MKHFHKLISAVLIGAISLSAGWLCGGAAVNAAPPAKENFTMPREVIGYLSINAVKLPPAKVEQSLWQLQKLWDMTQTRYESRLESPIIKRKLAKYSFRDLSQFRNIDDPSIQQLLTNILADGFRLIKSNDSLGLKIDYSVINPKITRYAPKPVAGYFNIIARSNRSNICPDGKLRINPDVLASHILEAESFLKNHPQFEKRNEISALYKDCLTLYLLGADQTPAFPRNKLDDRFLKSYQATAAKYTDTQFGQLITEYLTVLKQNKYHKTKQVLDFVKQKTV